MKQIFCLHNHEILLIITIIQLTRPLKHCSHLALVVNLQEFSWYNLHLRALSAGPGNVPARLNQCPTLSRSKFLSLPISSKTLLSVGFLTLRIRTGGLKSLLRHVNSL